MTKMSLGDKLGILLDVSKSSKLFFIAFLVIIFIGFIFITTNKKNRKTTEKIYLAMMSFTLGIIVIAYHSSLAKMFDYMMDNLFIIIYFPNIAIYIAAIIISNIILIISIFNFKVPKILKNINIIVYCIINYILVLLLNVITTNNLDVFVQESIYGNQKAQALIELSSIIFVIWILFLIVYKLIMIYLKKEYRPPVKKVIIKKVKVLPPNIKEVVFPKTINTTSPKALSIEQELAKQKALQDELGNLLTVDDYKLLLKLLKEHKEKERIAKEKQQASNDEQTKFKELQDLYNTNYVR